MKRWLTMQEVCEDLGVARSTVDDWRKKGRGPVFKKLPNGSLLIDRRDYEEWLTCLPEAV
jgi:predicted DNA-binding transcriptional regulator AlpA